MKCNRIVIYAFIPRVCCRATSGATCSIKILPYWKIGDVKHQCTPIAVSVFAELFFTTSSDRNNFTTIGKPFKRRFWWYIVMGVNSEPIGRTRRICEFLGNKFVTDRYAAKGYHFENNGIFQINPLGVFRPQLLSLVSILNRLSEIAVEVGKMLWLNSCTYKGAAT